MKSVHYLYEKTYLCRIMDESMSPDSLSRMLSSLPEEQSIRVMKRLTEKGEYVLMDRGLTIPSCVPVQGMIRSLNERILL